MSNLPPGADIEMWNKGPADPSRKIVRPTKIRVNGTELVTANDLAPFVHIHDFGGPVAPVLIDIKGIVVRSLKIHPVDPSAPPAQDDFKVLDGLAPGAGEAAKVGEDITDRAIKHSGQNAGSGVHGIMEGLSPDLAKKLADGFAGARPHITNITNVTHTPARPSYFRRVWNALRGR